MSAVAVAERLAEAAPAAVNGELVAEDPLLEMVDGQWLEKMPMGTFAAWVATRLATRLTMTAEKAAAGRVFSEALFILDREGRLRRRPDVAFVSAATWPLDRPLPPAGDWQIVPDLAVEIASPRDQLEAALAKIDEYFHYSVKQVWLIVPPLRRIYVYHSPFKVTIKELGTELDGGTLIPGFRLPVAELFREPAGQSSPTTAGQPG